VPQAEGRADDRAVSASGPDHFRHSYSKDKAGLIRRLSRMEGQVRGVARMIEREEYCVDILQQTAALRAAVDALSVLVLEDHVQGCIRTAAERGEADQYVDEVIDVVRRTLGRPVRTSGRSA
jgi:CsoR family transcriptional regulator, copper-sensing transcriptional repressor